ncbi:MAG: histidine kinase [Clostridia bacterium]
MKKNWRASVGSLRNRMVLWALIFILPTFVLLFSSARTALVSYEKQMQESIRQILKPFAREIDVTLENALRYLAGRRVDLTALRDDRDELRRLSALQALGDGLAADLSVQSQVDGIFLFDQGQVQFVTNYNRDYAENRAAADCLAEILRSREAERPFFQNSERLIFQQGFSSVQAGGRYYFYAAVDLADGAALGLWFGTETLLSGVREADLKGLSRIMFADHAGRLLSEEFNTPSRRKMAELLSGYFVVSERLSTAPFTLTALMDRSVVFSPFEELRRGLFVALGLATLFLVAYFAFLKSSILRPFSRLTRNIERVKEGDFTPIPVRDGESAEIRDIYLAVNAMVNEVESLKIRVYEEKLIKQNTQMQLFQLQLRPHFFLNALNVILSFARADQYEMIQKMTLCLAAHCRYILYNAWFVSDWEIPILGVQVFVENALKHSRDLGVEVRVSVSLTERVLRNERYLEVVVEDTGGGFSEETLLILNDPEGAAHGEDRGIGIENVRQRLWILYAGAASLVFSNGEKCGARVCMRLPVDRRKEVKPS